MFSTSLALLATAYPEWATQAEGRRRCPAQTIGALSLPSDGWLGGAM